jgi:hypothetical protein
MQIKSTADICLRPISNWLLFLFMTCLPRMLIIQNVAKVTLCLICRLWSRVSSDLCATLDLAPHLFGWVNTYCEVLHFVCSSRQQRKKFKCANKLAFFCELLFKYSALIVALSCTMGCRGLLFGTPALSPNCTQFKSWVLNPLKNVLI